ncbi:MAG: hypothetical protein SF123_18780 [Chloroflexota bacterium]|nr:hypothetical protein [Chloroflexota bacterium]
MRPSFVLVLLIGVFLISTGFAPDRLAFLPEAGFSDAVVSHYPAAWHIGEHGIFAPWRDMNMAGQPFAANPLNKTAYPPQLLALLLPPALHLNVMLILHLIVGALGMFAWARRLGLRNEAVLVSGVAFALAPRVSAHLAAGHLDLIYALAWFPWLMSAVHHLCQSRISALSFFNVPLIGSAALLILADVRLALFALATAAIYAITECIRLRRWLPLGIGGGVSSFIGVLTVGITVPLLLWQPYLSRSALTPQEAGGFSLSPEAFIQLLIPPPAVDVERLTHVGLAALLLALLAIAHAPRKHLLWIALVMIASWYALGSNGWLWTTLVDIFPPLLWFRVPARAWFVVALIIPLLAGYGAQALLEMSQQPPRLLKRLRLASGLALLLCALFGVFLLAAVPDLIINALRILLIGGAVSLIALLATLRRLRGTALAITLIALVFIDLAWNGRIWLDWRGADSWRTPYVALAEYLIADDADRIYSPAYSLPQQIAAEYDLHLFGGVDPFQLRGIASAIEITSGVGNQGYTVVQPPFVGGSGDDLREVNRDAIPDTVVLAAWQVSHIVAPYTITNPRLQLAETIENVYIYRNLDYQLTVPRDRLPRWANDAEGLPNAETVAVINSATAAAQQIGLSAFFLFVITGLWLGRKAT